jgi:hypothetical protein
MASGTPSTTMKSLVLGRDAERSMRLTAVAAGLFLAVFLLHLPPRLVGGLSVPFGLFLPALVALCVLVAAAGAFLNDGLLVSVALASGPSLGFYLPLALFSLTTPTNTVAESLAFGTIFAVVCGAVGFAAGAGVRRLARRFGWGTPADGA